MYQYIKRALDFFASLCGIIVLSPILILLCVLIRTKLGSPVLFKQERPGKIDKKTGEEKIFTLYKFRTMTDERDENGELLPDEIRLTKFGKLLRSTSLDELPEFINILKGDMSFIGPRPLLVKYLPLYSDHQRRRHLVRPGLSGWAQVNGRNALSWQDKFNLDVEYVDNASLVMDTKILFKTIMAVLKREGISSETSATMEAFTGNHTEVNQ